ncbi:MAG: hypothetical protein IKJ93_06725 [Clostridia bacterium]|nr:hypothetical protein [Clostridia bacterium]
MKKVRLISSVLEVIIGITLLALSLVNLVDEYWSGFGVAMIFVGSLFLLRNIKYHTNEKYREEIDVKNSDERNRFLSLKAWSWAGYLFVIIAAVTTIVFKFMGKDDLMMLSGGGVCLVVLLYYISYMVLRKKY